MRIRTAEKTLFVDKIGNDGEAVHGRGKNRKAGAGRTGGAVLLAVLAAAAISGCQGNSVTGNGTGNVSENSAGGVAGQPAADGTAGQTAAGAQPAEGSGMALDAKGGAASGIGSMAGKTAVYEDEDLDASWDEASSTIISCDGTGVYITGEGAAEENGIIRVTTAGTYVLRGNYSGQIRVEAGNEDLVRLVMDGFHISNESTSPVYGVQSKKIVLILADGTENSAEDGAQYRFASADEDEPDAVIFSKDDLVINGQGSLSVSGNYSNGVRSKDDLAVISGNLTITAVKDGLKGKDSVTVKDGQIQIKSGEDGIKSNNDTDPEKGYVIIDGGTIIIQSGDDGIHAETWLTISGGDIDVQESNEGLEGLKIDINGSNIKVKSTDDGINAAGGSSGTDEENERAKMQDNPEAYVRIAGGTVAVDAMADGIDSNGSLYVEAGTVYINGPTSGGDGALDYNGTAVINGGTFAAAGSAGMMQGFSEASGQNSILVFYSEKQEAGTAVVLTDEEGEELLAFTPEKEFECVLISVPGLEQGKSYQLFTAGQSQDIVMDGVMTQAGERPGGMGRGLGRGGEGGTDGMRGGRPGGEGGTDGMPGGRPEGEGGRGGTRDGKPGGEGGSSGTRGEKPENGNSGTE